MNTASRLSASVTHAGKFHHLGVHISPEDIRYLTPMMKIAGYIPPRHTDRGYLFDEAKGEKPLRIELVDIGPMPDRRIGIEEWIVVDSTTKMTLSIPKGGEVIESFQSLGLTVKNGHMKWPTGLHDISLKECDFPCPTIHVGIIFDSFGSIVHFVESCGNTNLKTNFRTATKNKKPSGKSGSLTIPCGNNCWVEMMFGDRALSHHGYVSDPVPPSRSLYEIGSRDRKVTH